MDPGTSQKHFQVCLPLFAPHQMHLSIAYYYRKTTDIAQVWRIEDFYRLWDCLVLLLYDKYWCQEIPDWPAISWWQDSTKMTKAMSKHGIFEKCSEKIVVCLDMFLGAKQSFNMSSSQILKIRLFLAEMLANYIFQPTVWVQIVTNTSQYLSHSIPMIFLIFVRFWIMWLCIELPSL